MEGCAGKSIFLLQAGNVASYKAVLVWVKAVQDVVLPSLKIMSKSLIYLLMYLSS